MSVDEIAEIFGVSPIPFEGPKYNLSPGQDVLTVTGDGLEVKRWGLVPWWAKDQKKRPFPQARAETVLTSGAFKSAKPCLVVFDGFYEWERGTRNPYLVRRPDHAPFAIAGVYDRGTCAVITTASHGPVANIHDRMPLVVEAADRAAWLETKTLPPENDLSGMELVPISKWVNDVKHDDPQCIAPL